MSEEGYMLADRYELKAQIGQGGMGVVWSAYDHTFEEERAIKQVLARANMSTDERNALNRQLLREARIAMNASRRLVDVGTIFDVVKAEDQPWIVMELYPHLTLKAHVDEYGAWHTEDITRTALRLLKTFAEIHRNGVLHRDIKPSNLMVREDGSLIVLDFGIARYIDDTVTLSASIVGTPEFMAPEYLSGQPFTPECDAWSLGVVLYYMATGKSPFERSTTLATIAAVAHEPYPALTGNDPIHQVIVGLLRKNPGERMILEEVIALLSKHEPETIVVSPPKSKRRPTRHWRKVAAKAVGVTAIGVLIAAVAFLPSNNPQDTADSQASSSRETATVFSTFTSQSSTSSSPTVSASPLPSTTGQVIGNVFTSGNLRIQAPAGWNFISATDTPGPKATLSSTEGVIRVAQLSGNSLSTLTEEQRRSPLDADSMSQINDLSGVSYPREDRTLWTYTRFQACWKFCSPVTWNAWSMVVKIDGTYVGLAFSAPVPAGQTGTSFTDARANVLLRDAIAGISLR